MSTEKEKATRKAYYEKHKEEMRAYQKAWRDSNKEKEKERKKAKYAENAEKEKERVRNYRKVNRERINARVKSNRIRNIKKINARARNYALKKRYGLSRADYEAKLIAQTGRCEICNIPFRNTKSEPSIDHNHNTGKVRALLCVPCNTGMAGLESPMLSEYLAYLKRHSNE